jgi:NADPH2:quinone reductase
MQPGERVLVSGASGAVGSIAVQLARAAGARVGTGRLADAGLVLDVDPGPASPDPAAPTFDLLIDAVGGPPLASMLERLVPGGRAVLVGYTAGRKIELDLAELMQRDLRLLPLNMLRREAEARAAAPEILARLADGRLGSRSRPSRSKTRRRRCPGSPSAGHGGRAVLLP